MSAIVIIRHATPARNLASIARRGLLPSLARSREKAIWLHTASRSAWAIQHTAARHQVQASDVILLTVRVPRRQLRRRRRGVWTCAVVLHNVRLLEPQGVKP